MELTDATQRLYFAMSKTMEMAWEMTRSQQRVVAALLPGSAEHEAATKVLLLILDSLHLLGEIEALRTDAERARDRAGE